MATPAGISFDAQALAAAQAGAFVQAAQLFERAARAHLEAGQRGHAAASFSNLGMTRKLSGDLRGALAALDEGIPYTTDPRGRRIALATRASILDALDDREAIMAWMECAMEMPGDAMSPETLFYLAHSGGSKMKHGGDWVASARSVLAEARTLRVTPSELAGIVGAFGESGGQSGGPMLAQAVVLMRRHVDAWNPSTLPFWDRLIRVLGFAHPLAVPLVAFAMVQTTLRSAAPPEHQALKQGQIEVWNRVAQAQGLTVDQLLSTIARDHAASYDHVEGWLRALVPPALWLID